MKKYIITQIPPEHAQLDFYFDGDTFTEAAGGLEYCLFIIGPRGWRDYNGEKYDEIQRTADYIIDGFEDVRNGASYNGWSSFKECMTFCGIDYNPRRCHALKAWSETADTRDPESIAEYLTITTGRPWTVTSARGYCQGDYCQILYCEDIYSAQDAHAAGEIYLGAANEFSITTDHEDGSEPETVYGYILADSQARSDYDVKRLICSWEGIDPADTVLRIIDGSRTYTEYTYRVA